MHGSPVSLLGMLLCEVLSVELTSLAASPSRPRAAQSRGCPHTDCGVREGSPLEPSRGPGGRVCDCGHGEMVHLAIYYPPTRRTPQDPPTSLQPHRQETLHRSGCHAMGRAGAWEEPCLQPCLHRMQVVAGACRGRGVRTLRDGDSVVNVPVK